MLETSLFESGGKSRTRKPATVLLSTALHGILVAVLLLVPLAHPQALPILSGAVGLPIPIVSAKPEPDRQPTATAPAVQPQIVPEPGAMITPRTIPDDIAMVVDSPAPAIAPVAVSRPGTIRDLIDRATKPAEVDVAPPPP